MSLALDQAIREATDREKIRVQTRVEKLTKAGKSFVGKSFFAELGGHVVQTDLNRFVLVLTDHGVPDQSDSDQVYELEAVSMGYMVRIIADLSQSVFITTRDQLLTLIGDVREMRK